MQPGKKAKKKLRPAGTGPGIAKAKPSASSGAASSAKAKPAASSAAAPSAKVKPAASSVTASSAAAEGQKRKGKGDAMLDDLFASLAPKKAERREEQQRASAKQAAEKAAADKAAKAKKKEKVVDPVFGEEYDLDSMVNPQVARVHRIDQRSGLNVYKAHHLGLGRGGYTQLCPFDCTCCF